MMDRRSLQMEPELPVDPTRGEPKAGTGTDGTAPGGTATGGTATGGPATDGQQGSTSAKGRRRWVRISVLSIVALTLTAGVAAWIESTSGPRDALVWYTAKRGDLPITVTERGTLESQHREKVLCAIDDIEGDQIRGTPILSILPNGSSVKKGEKIVEFDVSNHRERLDRQILDCQKAESAQIQAKVKFENQKTQNETTRAEAQLKVELAELDLKQFEDESGGTFQIKLQKVELLIQEAQALKLIEVTNLEGVEQLYKLGYRSRGELAQARLSSLKSDRQLASTIAEKKELVVYQYRKTKLQLQGAVESAKRGLLQVERDNVALLEQAEAVRNAADQTLAKEKERLARYQKQIENSIIFAPKDGMIAYAESRQRYYHEDIREGSTIRPRQHILSIPDLERMQIRTFVHESVLDQMSAGLPVTVRVEALPGRTYRASVGSIAVLADQDRFMSTGTKVYETVVRIDEKVQQLKPGMSAVVEIHVERLKDVVSVPVQAVVQRGEDSWCYVDVGGSAERRLVEIGRTNDKFVVIKKGVDSGDRVVLNTEVILQQAEESIDSTEISPEQGASPEPPPVDPEPSEDMKQSSGERHATGRPGSSGRSRGSTGNSPGRGSKPGGVSGGASGSPKARRPGGGRAPGAGRKRGPSK